jgi:hypothetical protein
MHGFSAQSVYVCGKPSQKSPPYIGGGLLHSLVLLLYPSPHVWVQRPQAFHADHCPFTESYRNYWQ